MTDALTALLEDLASETDPPPLDLVGIRQQARRRTTRKRLVAATLTVLSLAAGGATGAAVIQRVPDRDALQPAQHSGSAAPTEARLLHAVEASFPGTKIREINRIPAGPMAPGSSPYYAPGRTLAADELWFLDARTGAGDTLSVHWYVFDPPLTVAEADRYARGIFPDDPGPIPTPDAVRLSTGHENTGSLKSLLYAQDNQQLVSFAWSTEGAFVTASMNGGSTDLARAHVLDQLTRSLAGTPDPGTSRDGGLLFSLDLFSRLADVQRVAASAARVADLTGPRLVSCVSATRAVELANRDFTSDLDERGRPIRPTAIVRVVADGTLRYPAGPRTLRAVLLFDASSGRVLSNSSQEVIAGGPPLPSLKTLAGDEQPCPPVDGSS